MDFKEHKSKMDDYRELYEYVRSGVCKFLGVKFFQLLVLLANFALAIIGTIMIVMGALVLHGNVFEFFFMDYTLMSQFGTILVAIGGCVAIIGTLGVLAAVPESVLSMNLHSVLLLILLIAEVNVAITYAVSYSDFPSRIEGYLVKEFDGIKSEDRDRFKSNFWDYIQTRHECCGIWKASDWTRYNVTGVETRYESQEVTVPYSCCKFVKHQLNSYDGWSQNKQNKEENTLDCDVHYSGCATRLVWRVQDILALAGLLIGLSLVTQIFALVFGFVYARLIRQAKTEVEKHRQEMQHLILNDSKPTSTDA